MPATAARGPGSNQHGDKPPQTGTQPPPAAVDTDAAAGAATAAPFGRPDGGWYDEGTMGPHEQAQVPPGTAASLDTVRRHYASTLGPAEQVHGPATRAVVSRTAHSVGRDGGLRMTSYAPEFDVEFDDGAIVWMSAPGGMAHAGRYSDFRDGAARAKAGMDAAHQPG